jgi:hypothetical protein
MKTLNDSSNPTNPDGLVTNLKQVKESICERVCIPETKAECSEASYRECKIQLCFHEVETLIKSRIEELEREKQERYSLIIPHKERKENIFSDGEIEILLTELKSLISSDSSEGD